MKDKVYVSGLIALLISLLISMISLVAFRESFFTKMYHQLDTAASMGMSEADLDQATLVLLEYIKGERDSIDLLVHVKGQEVEMFNTREKQHMVDVRNLYQNALLVRTGLMLYACVLALIALGLEHYADIKQNMKNIRNALTITGMGFGGLALYALLDFNAFWTQFHLMFFSNDLWLLNPATDRMIQMFPEPFFNAMVIRILWAFVLVFALFLSAYGFLAWRSKDDSHRIIPSL